MMYTLRIKWPCVDINTFETYDEAVKALESYEEEDRQDGLYTPDYYEIVKEDDNA